MNWGTPEINDDSSSTPLLVGRDFGREENRVGRPFQGRAGDLLNQAMSQAGLRRKDVNITNVVNKKPPGNNFEAHSRSDVERGLRELRSLIGRLDPNLIVTMGNEASHALIDDWPGETIREAGGIRERRGYFFEAGGRTIVPTIHPASALRQYVPWRVLLQFDLERANRERHSTTIDRPKRDTRVVTSDAGADEAVDELSTHERLACDIEIGDSQRLSCVGFAGESGRAYVFPARRLDAARKLLTREQPRLVGCNFLFDLYWLLTRTDTRCRGFSDDVMLGWHACYPELAGSAGSGAKMSRKSLSFLASLYTKDRWWKDYQFESAREEYRLNGLDCMITLDVMQQLDSEIDRLGVRSIYEHEVDLVWPVVGMQRQGLVVDDRLRRDRIDALEDRYEDLYDDLQDLALPILRRQEEKLREKTTRYGSSYWSLYEETITCSCCRNGSTKRKECYSCADFETKPNKGDVVDWLNREGRDGDELDQRFTKDELFAEVFGECAECDGRGQWTELSFNPRSDEQKIGLFYHALNLPERYHDGSLSVRENKVRSLLQYTE